MYYRFLSFIITYLCSWSTLGKITYFLGSAAIIATLDARFRWLLMEYTTKRPNSSRWYRNNYNFFQNTIYYRPSSLYDKITCWDGKYRSDWIWGSVLTEYDYIFCPVRLLAWIYNHIRSVAREEGFFIPLLFFFILLLGYISCVVRINLVVFV